MQEIGAFEAKNTLGSLLDRVETGEEIVITRHGKPVARLVPVEPKTPRARLYGTMKDQIWIATDFDDDDPDTIAAADADPNP